MKLIDKSALVAEIARQKAQWRICKSSEAKYRREMLDDISSFLNTLEVKEVDLEKIITNYFKDWQFDDELDIMVKPNNYSASFTDLKEIAKHFFELGMAVNNKAQEGK